MTLDLRLKHDLPAINPNVSWAGIFVDELARCGLRAVCLAPGSRSTPLVLAFHAHPLIRTYPYLDERSASYFALGMAMASDVPVALVCTSGTAGINFHPAIVEAFYSRVPLLALTADRPPELRHSGANQTIDQVKMYGDHVLWSVDVALPQADAPPIAMRNLRTLAARAIAASNGLVKGPVHLNFPFRKPLEPSQEEAGTLRIGGAEHLAGASDRPVPHTRVSHGFIAPTRDQLDELTELIQGTERGLLICGPRCPGGDFPALASELSRLTGYPLFADALSGLRFGKHLATSEVIGGYDSFLGDGDPPWLAPEVVIRFGDVPTSKALNQYLDHIEPDRRIHISGHGVWADDSHRVSDFFIADPTLVCAQLIRELDPRPKSRWAAQIHETETACWQSLGAELTGEYFDGAVLADIVAGLPPGASLFAGNSLPVRHLDQFGRPQVKSISVYANRGASGIDGNVSSALGVAAALETQMVAVLGDITFYHDLNGLRAVNALGIDISIVLLNNGGGGIFHRLPVSQHEPPFTELFVMPHDLDFEPAVKTYGLEFVRVNDRRSFREAFADSLEGRRRRVIEVKTDGRRDYGRWQQVVSSVRKRVRERSIQAP